MWDLYCFKLRIRSLGTPHYRSQVTQGRGTQGAGLEPQTKVYARILNTLLHP